MIEASKFNAFKRNSSRAGFLFIAFLLSFSALIGAFFVFFTDENFWNTATSFHLLPWVTATAVVLLTPTAYLLYYKKFDVFHPLVHAAWSYWFPSFVVGGLLIASGYIYPYQMTLIGDHQEDFKWTYIYIMLGYVGMIVGFCLPFGKKIGGFFRRKMPAWDWQPRQVLIPAVAFLGVGMSFYVLAFISGAVGFSMVDTADSFAALNYVLSLLSLEAGFLVAMYIFKAKRITPQHIFAFAVILLLVISRMSLGANRSTLLTIVVLLAMAFVYSGRRLKPMHAGVFGVLAVLAVLGGMIYGTTFRHLKGSEERTGFNEQFETVGRTIDQITTQDTGKVLDEAFFNLAERIDGVSSVAVVVSNYERLKGFEAAHGIENNIITEVWTMFIPRFMWKDKPLIYDARAYSDLYFNFSGSSYTMTPISDLLRNFGPIGIPLGMIVIGLFLRIVYGALIEDQPVTIGRAATYYMFVVGVNYESYYTAIVLLGGRILLIVLISFLITDFFLISKKRS
jgi:hypothetical protein